MRGKIAAIISFFLLLPSGSYAVSISKLCAESATCGDGTGSFCMSVNLARCKTSTFKYYDGQYGVESCTSCASGESLTELTIDIPGCTNTVKYNDCCSGCDTSCTSDTTWSAYKEGYEFKENRKCECNTCVLSNVYRCAAGYYGIASLSATGCERCPANGSSAAGSLVITHCYQPAGATLSETNGTYTFTSSCSYTK